MKARESKTPTAQLEEERAEASFRTQSSCLTMF